ncbi:prenyltransferase, partial [bacterium]
FMSDGNLPGRGKYGENVQKALDYVLANAQESGLLAASDSHGMMYAHGFATLFLAEVYGMTGDEMVRERLQKAIRLIHQAQNAQGGWRYTPQPLDADVSVTICQVMALRAARDAGIKVEKETIDKAVAYVKKCQNEDGGFSYMLGQGGSMFPRSAAGVATLFYAGVYTGDEIKKGIAYVEQFTPKVGRGVEEAGGHFYYGHYYAVQSMFLAGGEHWAKWFPAIREQLLRSQSDAGSWSGDVTEEYATSMSLIILQMPKRYLPVFSGKGLGS